MAYRSDVVYEYDGSYAGFLCCVFESFARKEVPLAIETGGEERSTLFRVRTIVTDPEKAERVRVSIPKKMGPAARELIEKAFLSNLSEKELHLLYFMRLGYRYGPRAAQLRDHPDVALLRRAVHRLNEEAAAVTECLRFSEDNGVLLARIAPQNNVLPLIASHFCRKFSGRSFFICDKTHNMALLYRNGKREFLSTDLLPSGGGTPP